MTRLLALLLTVAALGASLTACAIHPPHLGGPRIVPGGPDRHDNGRHLGQEKHKDKGKHKNKHHDND